MGLATPGGRSGTVRVEEQQEREYAWLVGAHFLAPANRLWRNTAYGMPVWLYRVSYCAFSAQKVHSQYGGGAVGKTADSLIGVHTAISKWPGKCKNDFKNG